MMFGKRILDAYRKAKLFIEQDVSFIGVMGANILLGFVIACCFAENYFAGKIIYVSDKTTSVTEWITAFFAAVASSVAVVALTTWKSQNKHNHRAQVIFETIGKLNEYSISFNSKSKEMFKCDSNMNLLPINYRFIHLELEGLFGEVDEKLLFLKEMYPEEYASTALPESIQGVWDCTNTVSHILNAKRIHLPYRIAAMKNKGLDGFEIREQIMDILKDPSTNECVERLSTCIDSIRSDLIKLYQ